MKFSIIIPVYNVEKYLEQCLNSVLNQDNFSKVLNFGKVENCNYDYEIICVNDGSTDGSLKLLEQINKSTNKQINIINQANEGLSAARNAGILTAQGDYIVLLDSDDWLVPNALEILNNNIDNQDFIVFNGKRYFESGETETPDEGIFEQQMTGWEYYNKYARKSRKFHFVCAVLRCYRRDFLIKNSLFFEKGIYHEDNLFTPICCYYAQNVKVIPDILYIYRIREGSITQSYNQKKTFDTIKNANILSEFFIPKNIDKSVINREIAGMYFSAFMPPKNNIPPKEIKKQINFDFYKAVSTYRRHKIIFYCLKISNFAFNLFLKTEKLLKGK
ncbi:MAG: glycosyltransferase [Prevotellaceae bacterium]|jgi:glycosyltransferase involved in cell wall biosynthesis|nr:glycosyltransferase [Prevotellaceae bacterium]